MFQELNGPSMNHWRKTANRATIETFRLGPHLLSH